MKSHAQVVVIGGGVVGCSVLYHLTKAGWKDVVLLERDELTSGSTWHAAGGMHTLNGDPNVAKLQRYTIDLYKEIEEISGQSCGVHMTGGFMLADSQGWLDYLKVAQGRSRVLGLHSEFVSVAEAKEKHPLLNEKCFVGALYDPLEGHIDPSGVTHAYAKSARIGGAEIERFTRVTDLQPRPDGGWDVITDKGNIQAEHVVNAGGLWAREVGRMVGLELPILAMEHQYLVTDEMPEVASRETELPHCIDFGGEIYMRQERGGLVMGTYEQGGVPWSEKQTPWNFGHELLQPDLDRISDNLAVAFDHFPALESAGIKQVINGPFTFAPDGNPLVGPVRGLKNFWVACGVMAGFSQGGGVGLALTSWMTDGDPGLDIFAMDVARYGDFATMAYTNAKVRENYGRRFKITFPNEELPAARPLRTTPVYERLKAENAVFGAGYGLESALWFAPEGAEPVEEPSYRRSNAFAPVKAECKAVREAVGLIETSGFAKYEVTGAGAEAWLGEILANRMPRQGRIVLSPMLNHFGKLIGDFTVAKAGPEHFFIFGSGIAEDYHLRWFEQYLPDSGVSLRSLRNEMVGFSIAGPRSRELLARLTDDDVSNAAFPFMSFRRMDLGMVPAWVGRISFTGDLGYEIWISPDYQIGLYDQILAAGGDLGLRQFGLRALDSLRLEKGFGTWAREFRPIYTPVEAGLDRFVDLRKNAFVGRDAVLQDRENGPKVRLVTLTVDAKGADVSGDETVWHDGEVIGWVTSGGYAHFAERSVALAYVPSELAGRNGGNGSFEIEIMGDRRAAQLQTGPLFDPQRARMLG
ncbi:FAD-dependent oxidoreductase [Pelagibius litoralis]|uniref:FAD-dependent oxidoreductase n=1 Tax=Pelagibius litoralis TaxID=374515 RepID=A0A967C6F8_9PROT|nr:FAD-dependent oxidoreductase [Pelagibius litoralis]NIA67437.1 FAD-dependent oxidoreductase [Pelagibius litoralis]